MPRPEAVRPTILCFGEVLWDVFRDREVIGGAPFNVAVHLSRLEVQALIYSRLGTDVRGARARDHVTRFGLSDRWMQEDREHPTGWVDISLDASGQPSFQIGPDAAWDHIEPPAVGSAQELRAAGLAAIVCGTLASRSAVSRGALAAIRTALPDVPVFYDINLRGCDTPMERVREILPGVTLLKVNVDEVRHLAHGLFERTMAPAELFSELRRRHGIKLMLCTRGDEGCEVLSEAGSVISRAERVDVASAVGAGDAFSAAFLAGWLKGLPLAEAAANANRLGAYVAASPETIPEYSAALVAQLTGLHATRA